MAKHNIVPVNEAGDSWQFDIVGFTPKEISTILGFTSNVQDDPYKVKYSWGFTIDGHRCGIWDWKGSYRNNSYSGWGNKAKLISLFGKEHVV